ncbi:hypothetical protein Pint_07865 [Pistacia integerrima]|uniref:Uncharacterized protein n=1 Tax=Pistacia integerrima TaxID=434235 RepID=A0ACC0XXZ6_9ROSI|nr:hypothetical protein Pint_07865 [Pistacia integerrima]
MWGSGREAWPCFFLSPFFPASLVLLPPCLFFSRFLNLFPFTIFSPHMQVPLLFFSAFHTFFTSHITSYFATHRACFEI